MLEAKYICKKYSDVKALDKVSTRVEPGAATVVIGPSGGGKSTLVRLLSFVESADRGEIFLDGESFKFGDRVWRKAAPAPWPRVSVVFQQLFLWPHKTLADNVMLPALLQNRDLKRYDLLVQQLGISDSMNRFPNEVSVGQKQRAAIARALLLEPQYLLLDEVTAALDVEQIEGLSEALEDCLNRGTGILIVTHHLGFARNLITRQFDGSFLFLEKGHVIESGNKNVFLRPQTDRVQRFLNTMKTIG